jgi:peptidoglycan/LPS O-acetylase OafA/YrhL
MKRSLPDRRLQALSIVCGALPFAFALIRAFRTGGQDLRYLWVALAASFGATGILVVARPYGSKGRSAAAALSAGVFASATVFAMVAAVLLGTMPGLGMLVVASAFGLCFAAFSWLNVHAQRT